MKLIKQILGMNEKADPAAAALAAELTAARDSLAHALRVLIANRINAHTAEKGRMENAFELSRNALAATPAPAHLAEAAAALDTAAQVLANHSLADEADLKRTREAAARARTALARITPEPEA